MLRATITIVQKYVSAICDNPTKVDAKGHHHHCQKYVSAYVTTPEKVDAKGHHHLLKLTNLIVHNL